MESNLPQGWRRARLSDLVERVERRVEGSPQHVLMISSREGFIPQSDKYSRFMAGESLKKYIDLHEGEFAYNRGNSLAYPQGCVYQLRGYSSAAVPNVYFCFALVASDVCDAFLRHYFGAGSLNSQLEGRINSGVRNNGLMNIKPENFFDVRILLPSLQEQKKIAAILSAVDDAIEGTQAVIDQLQVVKKAVMAELLTRGLPGQHTRFKQTEIGELPDEWLVRPLEQWLGRIIDYRGQAPPKHHEGTCLITAKNVRGGFINPEPREYIADGDYIPWMKRGIPDEGDVMFTTEAPLGNAAPVPSEQIALGQRIITLCPDRNWVDPSFLLWAVLAPGFQALVQSKATGSTVKGIKQSVLRKLPIAMPSLSEQRLISGAIQSIANRCTAESYLRDELIATKSALTSVLLTGELRVTPDEVTP